jgi:hypothetical protein
MVGLLFRAVKHPQAGPTKELQMHLFLVHPFVGRCRGTVVAEGALQPRIWVGRLEVLLEHCRTRKVQHAVLTAGLVALAAQVSVTLATLHIGEDLAAVRTGTRRQRLQAEAVNTKVFDSVAAAAELVAAE